MQFKHAPVAVSAVFDDPNLVSVAGLVPMLRLARSAGLDELAQSRLSVPTDKGANAGGKVMALVAGMLAGADSIDDMNLLRHGGMGRLFDRTYAPSTLGSFLREFRFGHVRQLDAVASRTLVNLASAAPLLQIRDGERVMVDVDDTIIEVHGYQKQGASFGYSGVRGLVRTLAALGHTHIAHVSGPTQYIHTHERIAAWQGAMEAAGLDASNIVEGSFTSDGGRTAADILMTGARLPTAVFCANDLAAIGFMNRAIELGHRVPHDVSVAGFDGITIGDHVRPTLSTIRSAPRELGREAARLLLASIDGEQVPSVSLAPARLVLRDSVARVAQD